jgi:hypothetical protein
MSDNHILVLAEVRIPLDRIVEQVGAGVSSSLLGTTYDPRTGTKKSRTYFVMQRVEDVVAAFDHQQLASGTPGEREARQRLNAALMRLRASFLKHKVA